MSDRTINPAGGIGANYGIKSGGRNEKPAQDFESILKETYDNIRFSKHAGNRLNERGIEITGEIGRIVGEAIELASQKGIRDSLIFFDNTAFVVNVDTKTVVTAFEKNSGEKKVFTNIDGAVWI